MQNKPRKSTPLFLLFLQGTWQKDSCQQESVEETLPFCLLPFLPRGRSRKVALLPQLGNTDLKSGEKTHVLIHRNRTNEAKWFEKCEGIGISPFVSDFPIISMSRCSIPRAALVDRTIQQTRSPTERNTGLFNQRNSKTDPAESDGIRENPLRNELEKRIF